jgi:hypothetical protein
LVDRTIVSGSDLNSLNVQESDFAALLYAYDSYRPRVRTGRWVFPLRFFLPLGTIVRRASELDDQEMETKRECPRYGSDVVEKINRRPVSLREGTNAVRTPGEIPRWKAPRDTVGRLRTVSLKHPG